MSSRELEEDELEVLTDMTIAIDGIAVIVNKENSVDNFSTEQIRSIFAGDTVKWEEVE